MSNVPPHQRTHSSTSATTDCPSRSKSAAVAPAGAPRPTRIECILIEKLADILFALNPGLSDDYALASQAIEVAGCGQVDVSANPSFLKYPMWWMLDAPQSDIRIEFVDIAPHTVPNADPGFEHCAIVCSICDEQEVYHGLRIAGTYDSIKLYMAK